MSPVDDLFESFKKMSDEKLAKNICTALSNEIRFNIFISGNNNPFFGSRIVACIYF